MRFRSEMLFHECHCTQNIRRWEAHIYAKPLLFLNKQAKRAFFEQEVLRQYPGMQQKAYQLLGAQLLLLSKTSIANAGYHVLQDTMECATPQMHPSLQVTPSHRALLLARALFFSLCTLVTALPEGNAASDDKYL